VRGPADTTALDEAAQGPAAPSPAAQGPAAPGPAALNLPVPGPPERAPHRSGPRVLVVRLLLALGVVAALVASVTVLVRPPAAPPIAGPQPAAVPAAPAVVPAVPAAAPAPVRATTLDVPSLGIHTSALAALGVDAAGVLVPPSSTAVAGWFTGSAGPGELGPTVIAGHVDSYLGPGIFFHLDTMKPGDVVTVGRSDGATARYRVTDVLVVPKTQFPTDRVYGPTPGPELRLITCGGEFDRGARRYLRNVVVSAVLVGDYPGSP
jgi:Sortase domain